MTKNTNTIKIKLLDGNIKEALTELKNLVEPKFNTEIDRNIASITSSYNRTKNDLVNGLISIGDYEVMRAQISYKITIVLEKIESNHFNEKEIGLDAKHKPTPPKPKTKAIIIIKNKNIDHRLTTVKVNGLLICINIDGEYITTFENSNLFSTHISIKSAGYEPFSVLTRGDLLGDSYAVTLTKKSAPPKPLKNG